MSFLIIASLSFALVYGSLWIISYASLHAMEPTQIKNALPFVGPIVGLVTNKWKFFLVMRKRYDLPIYTLRMPFLKCYVINDTALIRAIDRQSHAISFAPIEAAATARFLGTTDTTNEIMSRDPIGEQGHFSTFHNAVRPSLSPGEGLCRMMASTFKALESILWRATHETPTQDVNLFQWVRHVVFLATTTGEYGPHNPFLAPDVEQLWLDFLPGVPYFAIGGPSRILAGKSFRAREALAQSFEQYFAGLKHLQGGSDALLARQRHGIDTGLPACDRAKGEIGSVMALTNNTVSSAFWLLYHIFADPAILDDCRRELSDIVHLDPDGTRCISLDRILSQCPTILATLNEVYRFYGVGTILVRQVVEDHLLDKTYLLKKGNIVLMPTSIQHYSEATWGPDAHLFDHRRFMKAGAIDNSKRLGPAGSRVFGGGPLLCPGRHFAHNVVLTTAAMVVLRFDMRPVCRGVAPCDLGWNSVKAADEYGLGVARVMLQPENDMCVKLTSSHGKGGRSAQPVAPWRVQL